MHADRVGAGDGGEVALDQHLGEGLLERGGALPAGPEVGQEEVLIALDQEEAVLDLDRFEAHAADEIEEPVAVLVDIQGDLGAQLIPLAQEVLKAQTDIGRGVLVPS